MTVEEKIAQFRWEIGREGENGAFACALALIEAQRQYMRTTFDHDEPCHCSDCEAFAKDVQRAERAFVEAE